MEQFVSSEHNIPLLRLGCSNHRNRNASFCENLVHLSLIENKMWFHAVNAVSKQAVFCQGNLKDESKTIQKLIDQTLGSRAKQRYASSYSQTKTRFSERIL